MEKLSLEQIQKIESFAREVYTMLDDTHSQDHANKVEKLAIFLASKEGGNPEICRLGGLLHQYHPERASEVNSFLIQIHINDSIRRDLVHCVECVELETIHKARTIEAKIVFDADKLQTLGPYGFIREVVYRTRNNGITFMQAFEEARVLQERVIKNLQTKTARDLYDGVRDVTRSMIGSVQDWNELSFTK
jgi:HD superfamily phosphodiesterase